MDSTMTDHSSRLVMLIVLFLSTTFAAGAQQRERSTSDPKSEERAPASAAASAQDVPKAARDTLDRALKMSQAGRTVVALALMQEAVKIYPDFFDAHLALANALIKAGRLDEAIAELDQARRIDQNDHRPYQGFGIVLILQGKYPLAAAVFAEAFRLNPSEPYLLLMRGVALVKTATGIDPSKSETAAADRKHLLDEAEQALTKAYNLSDKKLVEAHLYLASLYDKRGEYGRAADELERYLLMSPGIKNADEIHNIIQNLRKQASAGQSPQPPQ